MICVPLRFGSIKLLLASLKVCSKRSCVVEVWFDELNVGSKKELFERDLSLFFAKLKNPLLYKFQGDLKMAKILSLYSDKLDYLDIDLTESPKTLKELRALFPNSKIIISYHNFKETPQKSTLSALVASMIKKGADIVKIATQANSFKDTLVLVALLDQLVEKNIKAICLTMGESGKFLRATSHLLGNYLLYAPLSLKDKTAKGQLTLSEVERIHMLKD